jgi:hypothetical protein
LRAAEIRAVAYGLGAMGRLCVRLMTEKGVSVVGGLTRASHLGEDLGDACGVGHRLGVAVSNDPEAVLSAARADIAILSVATYLDDMAEHIERCARHGVNVITTAEEVFYSWRTEPELTAEIDRLAKDHGITVLGSGYNDYFWGGEVTQLAGCCQRIDRIEGVGQFNIDDYGPQVARNVHVGESPAEFEAAFGGPQGRPSIIQPVADLICAELGLTVTSVRETIRAATEGIAIPCRVLDTVVPPGAVTGKVTEVDVETAQGTSVHLELRERLYLEGETDLNRWTLRGVPDVALENPAPATDVLTCATMVNRIPDVIRAPAGYLTVDKLPRLRYRPLSLERYLDEGGGREREATRPGEDPAGG